MPYRVRTDKRAGLTPRQVDALAIGIYDFDIEFGSVDAARRAWEEHQADLRDLHAGRRPEAWWRFTPGVPEHLRDWTAVGGWVDDQEAFQRDRLRWLAEEGLLLPDEAPAVLEELQEA